MTRPLPSSELQLTRVQIRNLVACDCGALAGSRCLKWTGPTFDYQAENHQARVTAARALLRSRRLAP